MAFTIFLLAVIVGALVFALPLHQEDSFESDWVGICVHSLSVEEARFVDDSGAGWVRVDVSPDFGEVVANAEVYGLKVLGILDSWMFNQSTVFTFEEWQNAVTAYVSNYSDGVDAWEIWNEPFNPEPNWTITTEKYLAMVQIAAPIIRQYDPSAKILLFGGLNLYSGGDPHLEIDKGNASQLAAQNISQYGDAVSVHAYPWGGKVDSIVWERYAESLAFYFGLFNASGVPLEVWVTETGQQIEFGQELQAQYMDDMLDFFDEKVTRVFWYSLIDDKLKNGDIKNNLGLIDNGTVRQAYNILREKLAE